MKRYLPQLLLLVALLAPWAVQAQPAMRVIIMDPTGTHAASVAGGNLGTTASVGDVTVESITTLGHITSAVHVAGIANTVMVNCVTGCAGSAPHTAVTQAGQWTIAHIAAAVHVVVGGRPGVAAHQAGTWTVDIGSGTVAISGGTVQAAQSGAWNVSAAQSGLWSIAAAHIVGGSGHLAVTFAGGGHVAVTQGAAWTVQAAQSGAWAVTATIPGHVAVTQAGTLSVSCSNCTGGSSDAVNVFHQSTIRHISSVTHVAITSFSREAHLAAAQSGAWSVSAHIIGGSGHIAITQAAALSVSCSNCTGGSSDAVNVFHQSTIRHVSSVTHVYVVDLPRSAHLAAAQSGAWTVQAAHQGGAWVVNVGHIAAMLHVAIVDLPRWAHMAVAQSGVWNVTAHLGGTSTVAHITSVTHVLAIESPAHTKSSFQKIAASDANYRILHLNSARVGFTIYNHAASGASATMYVRLGQHATVDSFTVIIPQGGFYECPKPCYTGDVDAVWRDSVQGSAKVTEFTR